MEVNTPTEEPAVNRIKMLFSNFFEGSLIFREWQHLLLRILQNPTFMLSYAIIT